MLLPRRTKYRKMHRGRRAGQTKGQATVQFGDYGIKALEAGWITNRQIEAARIAMTRKIKRGGKVWINVFPDKPYTKKPAETRMGKGKGSPEGWVAVVKPGRVMFELAGVPEPLAKEAALGIHRNVARSRLERLVKASLTEARFERRTGRSGPGAGRPARTYSVAPEVSLVEFPPHRYAGLIAILIESLPSRGRAEQLRRAGVSFGEQLARTAAVAPARTLPAAVRRVCSA